MIRRTLFKGFFNLLVVVFGAGIIAAGILIQLSMNQSKGWPETTAVINDIQIPPSADGEGYDHTVFVEYTSDGGEYIAQLDEYRSSFSIGQEVDIRYNPDNPTDVRSANPFPLQLIFFIIGGLMFFVPLLKLLVPLIYAFIKRDRMAY